MKEKNELFKIWWATLKALKTAELGCFGFRVTLDLNVLSVTLGVTAHVTNYNSFRDRTRNAEYK